MALRRHDNGCGVLLDLDTSLVPSAPEMQTLFPKVLAERADGDEQARFAMFWQARVAQMLIEHAEDPRLVLARDWKATA